MFQYLTYLGKFDDNYEIRDMVRYVSSIFDNGRYEIATLLLQAPKPDVWGNDEGGDRPLMNDNMQHIDSDVVMYHGYIPWDADVDIAKENGIDLRESIPTKDYDRFKKSFSSDSYNPPSSSKISQTSISHKDILHQNDTEAPNRGSNSYTSSSGKKYRLQSLDEFFSDVPERPVTKKSNAIANRRKTATAVESSSEESETESSGQDDSDEEEESSGEEDSDTADDVSETSMDSEDGSS